MAAPSRFTTNLEIDKISPVLNLYVSSVLKAAFGHDGSNGFLSIFGGNLVLNSATGKILPEADGSQDIGDTALAKRFGALHLKNELWVAGVQVIDTNGRVTLPGFARDGAGKVLEAQGTEFYPMYVDPNGRYTPATHTHDSVISGNRKVQVDATNAVLNFYVDASLKGAIGHDGANYFVVAYAGNLVLWSATGKILPNGSMDLGDASTKFGNGYFSGAMDAGWLNVAGFTAINASRQLVNTSVSAASIDRDGVTADVPVAKVGGGTRTLHFVNSRYTGYTDS